MSEANELVSYEKRIREIAPEIGIDPRTLTRESLSLNQEGLLNDIVIVNNELVFRFPKADYAFKQLKDEAGILRLLQNHITLQIPAPIYESNDVLAYRLIPGEALRRDLLLRLPESDQQAIADQLAQFLKELHNVPVAEADFEIPPADALMKHEGWLRVYERIRQKVVPLLLPHLREWMTEHFESYLADKNNFEYELKLV
ncbi:MAG TPA: phosphotransferase, partial [Pyrinomonadaceae bacterium]|nr:phosphotransferase [Pyrinomonadaceae bacterium]